MEHVQISFPVAVNLQTHLLTHTPGPQTRRFSPRSVATNTPSHHNSGTTLKNNPEVDTEVSGLDQ